MLEEEQIMQDEGLGFHKKRSVSQGGKAREPDFFIEKDAEGRFRLWFHNSLEPHITVGDWVAITISPRCFVRMVENLSGLLREMTDEE